MGDLCNDCGAPCLPMDPCTNCGPEKVEVAGFAVPLSGEVLTNPLPQANSIREKYEVPHDWHIYIGAGLPPLAMCPSCCAIVSAYCWEEHKNFHSRVSKMWGYYSRNFTKKHKRRKRL